MKKMLVLIFIMLLTACSSTSRESGHMGGGMGSDNLMRTLHHAEIPAPYAGIQSPIEADFASIERGKEIYRISCAECHGEGGMGDGQTGKLLNPSPAFIAHSSQMTADGYLFWRISEGGAEFGTGMPAFKDKLEENEIWDAINYVRALGRDESYDPEFERAHHQSMVDNAIEEEFIDKEQADNFMLVHEALNTYMAENDIRAGAKSVDEMQPEIFAALVEIGTLTQEEVDSFNDVHQLLLDEGLMQ